MKGIHKARFLASIAVLLMLFLFSTWISAQEVQLGYEHRSEGGFEIDGLSESLFSYLIIPDTNYITLTISPFEYKATTHRKNGEIKSVEFQDSSTCYVQLKGKRRSCSDLLNKTPRYPEGKAKKEESIEILGKHCMPYLYSQGEVEIKAYIPDDGDSYVWFESSGLSDKFFFENRIAYYIEVKYKDVVHVYVLKSINNI